MEIYLTTMFWLGVLMILVRSVWLVGDHPRLTKTTLGADVFGLLFSAAMLAWVAWLKFGG